MVDYLVSLTVVRICLEVFIFWFLSTFAAILGFALILALVFAPVYFMIFAMFTLSVVVLFSLLIIPVGGILFIPCMIIAAISGFFYVLFY